MRKFTSHLDGYFDVSDQMAHDLRRRAEVHFRRQEGERAAITGVEQFERERERVRAAFLDAIGGLPERRTALDPRVTGALDRGAYRIEKVIYHSLPDFPVTANLYVPAGLNGPVPGILLVCGHSEDGKAEPRYQAVCSDLAANGFVVLAMDPPGQGERLQYLDPANGDRLVGGCTIEHCYTGLQYTLTGGSIARQFVWDGMRSIDYLASRPEVDAERIGVTGNSGGGTQTCLLLMSDPRIAAAVPCCFVMTLGSYMKSGQSQDAEQIVAGAISRGPDYYQYLTAMAPKPVMVGASLYDFFPIEGARESVRRAREVYRLYGAEDNVGIAYSPHTHGFSAELRQAVVNWMRRHLMGKPGNFVTGEPEVLPASQLWCTDSGQVLLSHPGSRTIHHLCRERLDQVHSPAGQSPEARRQALVEALGIGAEDRDYPIDPRVVYDEVLHGYRTEHVYFFSGEDVLVAGVMIHPQASVPVNQTVLVLLPDGSEGLEAERPHLERLLAEGNRLFVFDVRGIGAVCSRPVNPQGVWAIYGTEFKLACDAMMMGTSTLGLRVHDVTRGLQYLRTRDDCAGTPIGLYGRGFGALLAYLAAAIDGHVAAVTAEDMLYSYRELVDSRYYDARAHGMWSVAWGLLRRLDLADLLPCIAPARCRLVSLRDARGGIASASACRREYLDSRRLCGTEPTGWQPLIELPATL
ncbi:MAG: alpha/beta hydrolase family protein [Anaerolineae bacterium]